MFRFCIDVAVNNAFQLYRLRKLHAGESRMDALEFIRAFVEAYYNLHRNERPITLLPGARATGREHVRRNEANHWIVKGQQRRCAGKGFKGTSVFIVNFVTLDCIITVSRHTTLSDM